jgi:hypothetical protein
MAMIRIGWSIRESFEADVDEDAVRECFDPDDHRLDAEGRLDLDSLLGDTGYGDLDSLLADLETPEHCTGVQERGVDRMRRRAENAAGEPVRAAAAAPTTAPPAGGSDDALRASLLAALNPRAYDDQGEPGDRTAYHVVDLHGVSIGVRRRQHDLYVHIDTTETPDELVAVEINGGGEHDHPAR